MDGISLELLVMGAPSIAATLINIFNQSISDGGFPSNWKEALVTPVLKKGDPKLVDNYRPVSYFPAASKLLEMIICDQTSAFIEENIILPSSQHVLRAAKSTMSVWAEMQQEWASNTDSQILQQHLLIQFNSHLNCPYRTHITLTLFMSPAAPVFHTVVTVSIVLKSTAGMITSILHF